MSKVLYKGSHLYPLLAKDLLLISNTIAQDLRVEFEKDECKVE
jgi:hypothetical protein